MKNYLFEKNNNDSFSGILIKMIFLDTPLLILHNVTVHQS